MGNYFQSQVSLDTDFAATPDTVHTQASAESQSVRDDISQLRMQADTLAEKAKTIIADVADFDTRTVPGVGFRAELDDFMMAERALEDLPGGLYLDPELEDVGVSGAPSLSFSDFFQSSFSLPSSDPLDFPDAPTNPSVSAPRRFTPQDVSVPDAPTSDIELKQLGSIGGAPAFSGSFRPIDFYPVDVDPIGDIELPDLTDFDRLPSVVENTFVRNPYTHKMLPQTLTAASALLNGNFILDMDALEGGVVNNLRQAIKQHNQRTSKMWTRRGFSGNPAIAEYNDRVESRFLEDQRKSFDAAVHRWRMRLLPTALQLNIEAHSLTTEILGELYDLDFAMLEAEHTALRSLYALAAARYNAAVSSFELQVARYRGIVARARALADIYRSKASQQRAVGRLNRVRGDSYEAAKSADEAEGDSFIATVRAAEALVSAYDTQMRNNEAQARALRADVVRYDSDLASWEADFTSSLQDHRETRSHNRAVVARNRGMASQMSAEAAQQEGVAFDARASAMDTIKNVSKLRAEIETRGASYVETRLGNTLESLEYAVDTGRYTAELLEFETELLEDNQRWQSQNRINSNVASLYRQISSNVGRAARLTQQHRVELADAYQRLYETVGKAEASRIAGELSRYSASLGLQTTGAIDYSSNAYSDTTGSTDVSNSQSNRVQRQYEAPKD